MSRSWPCSAAVTSCRPPVDLRSSPGGGCRVSDPHSKMAAITCTPATLASLPFGLSIGHFVQGSQACSSGPSNQLPGRSQTSAATVFRLRILIVTSCFLLTLFFTPLRRKGDSCPGFKKNTKQNRECQDFSVAVIAQQHLLTLKKKKKRQKFITFLLKSWNVNIDKRSFQCKYRLQLWQEVVTQNGLG